MRANAPLFDPLPARPVALASRGYYGYMRGHKRSVRQPLYITMREAGRILGVSSPTLRHYDQRGLRTTYRTPGRHRRFPLREARQLAGLRSVQS